DHPSLMYALSRHGVVGTAEDGSVQLGRPRALRAALDLHRIGLTTVPALEVLSEVLDTVRAVTQDIVAATSTRMMARTPEGAQRPQTWEDLDRYTVALTQGLVTLLTESLRVTVENHA